MVQIIQPNTYIPRSASSKDTIRFPGSWLSGCGLLDRAVLRWGQKGSCGYNKLIPGAGGAPKEHLVPAGRLGFGCKMQPKGPQTIRFQQFSAFSSKLFAKNPKNCSFRSLESLAFLLFGTWHTLTQLTKNRTVQIHLTFCKAPKIIVYHSNVWRWLMTTESAVRMNQNDPKRHKMIKNMPRAVVRYSMTCESIETI